MAQVLINQHHVSREVAELAKAKLLQEYDPRGYGTRVDLIPPSLTSDFWRLHGWRQSSCD